MMKWLLFVAIGLIHMVGLSQVMVNIDVKMAHYETGKKLSGATLTVLDGATTVKTATSPSNGNIKFSIPAGKKYKFVFSKPGKVNRFLNLDAKDIDEARLGGKDAKMVVQVSLFDEQPNIDYSYVLKNPFTEFYYEGSPDLVYDQIIAERMRKKIEALMAEADKKESQTDIKYQKAIEAGDSWYKQKKYEQALAKYEEALLLKPKEKYPAERVKELDGLLKAMKQNELVEKQNDDLYNKTIKEADALRDQKKYEQAIAKYEQAVKLKNEQYPKSQISSIQQIVAAEKQKRESEAKYTALIKEADDLYDQQKYAQAKVSYKNASSLKPSEVHPKQRIADIDQKLKEAASQAAKKKQYDEKIRFADQLYKTGKLPEAKKAYEQASLLDNTESYPKDQIKKIDLEIIEAEKQKKKIEALLIEGNSLFGNKDWEGAKGKYEAVLKLQPSNPVAKAKLAEIEKNIRAEQLREQQEKEFQRLKSEGLSAYNSEDWEKAKSSLTQAKKIKLDPEIEQKLVEIDKKIQEEAAYQRILREAEALERSNIDGAIAKYQTALNQRPNDGAVKNKIADLKRIKEERKNQAEIDRKYQDAMKKGNTAFVAKNYTEAIKWYNEAGMLKPKEKEPVDRAAEAERLEKENSDKQENEAYLKILKVGQKAIDEKNWDKAMDMYNRASKLKPNDQIPKNKLKEVERLRKEEQESEQLEEAYKEKIKKAEASAAGQNYQEAINYFEEAKKLKPTEATPPRRIKELKILLNKELEGEKRDAMYQKYMTSGDQALDAKDYQKALSDYRNALTVKDNDPMAISKIKQVERLIDEANNKKNEADQKKRFDLLVKEGDNLFKASDWSKARQKYEEALGIISSDAYARRQVDKCIKNLQAKPDEQKQYNKLISKADDYFNSSNYNKAKELYNRALTLKSNDPYPQKKLNEIEQILNPKPVVSSNPQGLPNLGLPTSEDPKDVLAALERAERERKNRRRLKMDSRREGIENSVAETGTQKMESIYDSRMTIEGYEKDREDNSEKGIENRRKYEGKLVEVNHGIENERRMAIGMKYNENLNAREILSNVESERSADYHESDQVYLDNTASVKTYNLNVENAVRKSSNEDYLKDIDNQGRLSEVKVKYEDEQLEDFDSRKEIEEKIRSTVARIEVDENKRINEEYENIALTNARLENESKLKSAKFQEDAKLATGNKEELKITEKKLVENDIHSGERALEESLSSDNTLSEKKKKFDGLTTEQDQIRVENTEQLKVGAKKIDDVNRREFQENLVKNIEDQGELAAIKRKTDVITKNEKANQDVIVDQVVQLNKDISIRDVNAVQSDEEERLRTKTGISTMSEEYSTKQTEDIKKTEENTESMKIVSGRIEDHAYDESLGKQEKLTNARLMLDKISSKQMQFDDKVANELGKTYPEGVSQETFNKTDEDGLLVSVVTRRVVVKNGHGQIYVRTQSLTGITYQKNGSPSSEYVWQRETNDAALTKNY
ncbi:MAG: hypothetical protein EP338_02365 [Bacteroidetes bacterium]|nr:MAG: hypothetical protein EP338_02365 [Bacteroidota bacterium]